MNPCKGKSKSSNADVEHALVFGPKLVVGTQATQKLLSEWRRGEGKRQSTLNVSKYKIASIRPRRRELTGW